MDIKPCVNEMAAARATQTSASPPIPFFPAAPLVTATSDARGPTAMTAFTASKTHELAPRTVVSEGAQVGTTSAPQPTRARLTAQTATRALAGAAQERSLAAAVDPTVARTGHGTPDAVRTVSPPAAPTVGYAPLSPTFTTATNAAVSGNVVVGANSGSGGGASNAAEEKTVRYRPIKRKYDVFDADETVETTAPALTTPQQLHEAVSRWFSRHTVEQLARCFVHWAAVDPVDIFMVASTVKDDRARQALAQASVVSEGRNSRSPRRVTMPLRYHLFLACVTKRRTPGEVIHVITRDLTYGYLAWSLDDAALLEHRVPDRTLREPLMTRHVFAVADIAACSDDVVVDLTRLALFTTVRLQSEAYTLFGGRLARAVGPTLMREPRATRLCDLGPCVVAMPQLSAAPTRFVSLVRSIPIADLCDIFCWQGADRNAALQMSVHELIARLAAVNLDVWTPIVGYVNRKVGLYAPMEDGTRALAATGVVPDFLELFGLDLCLAPWHDRACLFAAVRGTSTVDGQWHEAFDRAAKRYLAPLDEPAAPPTAVPAAAASSGSAPVCKVEPSTSVERCAREIHPRHTPLAPP